MTSIESSSAVPPAASATERLRSVPGPELGEASLAQLGGRVRTDVSQLVSAEVELAKLELGAAAKTAGMGAGMLAAAGVLLLVAVVLAAIAIAEAIRVAGLSAWASFLITAGGYLALAALIGLIGGLRLKAVSGPTRTLASAKASLAAAAQALKAGR